MANVNSAAAKIIIIDFHVLLLYEFAPSGDAKWDGPATFQLTT